MICSIIKNDTAYFTCNKQYLSVVNNPIKISSLKNFLDWQKTIRGFGGGSKAKINPTQENSVLILLILT